MKRESLLASFAVMAIIVLAFLSVLVPSVHATVSTSTITGWLFPDGTHLANGIGVLFYPLIGVGLLAGLAKVVEAEGGFGVTLILAGLTIGGVLGMLSVNASLTNLIPFSLVVIPGIDMAIWMWKGEG